MAPEFTRADGARLPRRPNAAIASTECRYRVDRMPLSRRPNAAIASTECRYRGMASLIPPSTVSTPPVV
jgi:hypothetical protein